jgi:ferredoxin
MLVARRSAESIQGRIALAGLAAKAAGTAAHRRRCVKRPILGAGSKGSVNHVATTEIAYFSATGNSLAIARYVADRLEGDLVPVIQVADRPSHEREADIVGLVFPIYGFRPPQCVFDYLEAVACIEAKYIFAICTHGTAAPGRALKRVQAAIESCGGRLSGGFAVPMPHNGVGCGLFSDSKRASMLQAWEGTADEICEYVLRRDRGRVESGSAALAMLRPSMFRLVPVIFRFFGALLTRGSKGLDLAASDACTACGVCARVCPTENIELREGKPVWGDRCLTCFACLHWCPEGAISLGGLDVGMTQYHHPDVTLADMLAQRESIVPPEVRDVAT